MRFDTRHIGTIVIVACRHCSGSGASRYEDAIDCEDCGGNGEDVLDVTWMAMLANNLATVGALYESFNRGLYNRACADVFPSVDWCPGCGWAAP